MSKELVLSVLSKLQSYMEAESQLGLHHLFKTAQECGSQLSKSINGECKDGYGDKNVGARFDGLAYIDSLCRGVEVQINFSAERNKKKPGYAARKPLTIKVRTTVKLVDFQGLSQLTGKLEHLGKPENLAIDTDNSNYIVTFMNKSVTLFKELKLTKEEAERKIILAALLHLSSYWNVQLSDENNEDLAEAAVLASELAADSSFGDTTLYSKQWHESVDKKKLTRYLRMGTVYNQLSHKKAPPGSKIAGCPRKVDLYYRQSTDDPYVRQRITIKANNAVLEDDEICSSCDNQLSCLASNYMAVPYQAELVVPL